MKETRSDFIKAVASGRESRKMFSRPFRGLDAAQLSQTKSTHLPKVVANGPTATSANSASDPTATTAAISRDPDHTSINPTIMLKEMAKARNYLDSVFSIYLKASPNKPPKRLISLCKGFIRFFIPCPQNQCTDKTPYVRCLLGMFYLSLDPRTLQLRHILALHVTISGEYSITCWPRLLNRVYELNKRQDTPRWKHLMIASDLYLSQIPSTKSTKTWISEAMLQFLLIAVLIIQVELTIAWNRISGLDSLSPLGQLIPFIIGVGGLVKVLWGKACLIKRGIKDDFHAHLEREGEYEEAMAEYLGRTNDSLGKKMGVERAVTA
ncbi:MAG: hypothetical protein Q9217_002535 [Psora testacea]